MGPDPEVRDGELRILYETIRDLTSTLSVDRVIERLLDRALAHLDSEIVSILLQDADQRLRIRNALGLPEEVVAQTRLTPGDGISGYVFQSGEALLIEDVEADPRFRRRNHERYYTHSAVSVPLRIHGAVRGVINVNNKRSRAPYTEADLRLMEAIAGHAAVALLNAERYEDTLARAQHDALTGLANHGHFWSTLEIELERARRYGRELGLVMIDVDRFKAFNDRFGHRAGDRALAGVARVIRQRSRLHDFAARYGGEEFAVVLPETGPDGARSVAEKLRQAIEASALPPADAGELTVSAGVGAFPRDARGGQELVDATDARLYAAKAAGRNRVCADG